MFILKNNEAINMADHETTPKQAAVAVEVLPDLPELKFTEIQKSENPINKVGDGQLKIIEGIRPWNDYTIVILENHSEILIFDENALPVKDFKESLAQKAVTIHWTKVRQQIGKDFIAYDKSYTNCYPLSQLPSTIRGFAKLKLKLNPNQEYFQVPDKDENFPTSHLDVTPDGKYIVIHNGKGGYFAFLTQNKSGVVLAPRNWVRIDSSYREKVPEDLEEFVKELEVNFEGYRPLNEKYTALITDVAVNIVERDNLKGSPVFSTSTPSVEKNIATDPTNPNVIYYCQSSNPTNIMKLDLVEKPSDWSPITAKFPQKYESVHNLQLDPTGNFFLFYSKEDLVVVTKDGLEEVKRVPKLTQVNFDGQGRIRAIDKDGHLVVYEPNFRELAQELDKQRIARLVAGIKITDIFNLAAAEEDNSLQYLQPLRTQYEEQFKKDVLAKITQKDVQQLRDGLNQLRDTLKQQGFKPNEITFVIEGLETLILEKEKEFAVKGAQDTLTRVRTILSIGLSITSISEAQAAINTVKATKALLTSDLLQGLEKVAQELEQKSLELFHQRGEEIIKDVHKLVKKTEAELEAFTSKAEMDDWLEFKYPQLKSRLYSLANDCPLEADEAYKSITAALNQLQDLATSFEEKFKREYAKVREKAAERTEAVVNTIKTDIEGLINRLSSKGFTDRKAAEQYLDSSDAKKTIEEQIEALKGNNPDFAKELYHLLNVSLSNALTEIERRGMTQVAETGQQMILFGQTLFPKWEAKVKEKEERKVELVFNEDPKTHGPGVKAGEILGDVAVNIKTSAGKEENVRLYQGWKDENEWRLGLLTYRGEAIPPSYVTAAEYRTIKKEYTDWAKGEQSSLQKELQEKRNALKEIYSRRQKIGERTPEIDEAWKQEYQEKLKEYAAFVAEHHIPILKRIDQIKAKPEIEYTNGRGFVPEWQSHWVNDPQTEKDLEEMAKAFKMQLDLQEGILNLKGHAGTGKDVRLKMFAALTNRPYFAIDCTKWTTEFELSEDVMLESKDGASQTIKVPSTVLNGITTPGAIVYFNEFTAMPEQSQIFLHALMDEKRAITLKTSSGKVIRAHPSVLLASSENPGYPGTFAPQFATKSRRVSLEIGYPPLTRKPEAGDTNPNPLYDASEALRIARGVDSLADLTYEASIERNVFVKIWDKYVNGIENGAPDPTVTQRFDIDTILTLVQFANNLRDNFIKIFEKSRDARNALPVSQPITGRELRRCAYALNKITPEEKATANPETVARNLLEKYWLTHIDKNEDREKILNAMKTWTSQKRVKT